VGFRVAVIAGGRTVRENSLRLTTSESRLFRDFHRVIDLDAQVPHGGLQFRLSELKLHSTEVLGASIAVQVIDQAITD